MPIVISAGYKLILYYPSLIMGKISFDISCESSADLHLVPHLTWFLKAAKTNKLPHFLQRFKGLKYSYLNLISENWIIQNLTKD